MEELAALEQRFIEHIGVHRDRVAEQRKAMLEEQMALKGGTGNG